MCNDNEILNCTAQDLGILVHGSHDNALALAIIPLVFFLLLIANNYFKG